MIEQIYKEYTELKYKLNKVITRQRYIMDKKKLNYLDYPRMEHLKMQKAQLEKAIKKKGEELKEVL